MRRAIPEEQEEKLTVPRILEIVDRVAKGELLADKLVQVGIDDQIMYVFSQRSMILAEKALQATVKELHQTRGFHSMSAGRIDDQIRKAGLEGEQADAARHALGDNQLAVVKGWAGAGKSFTARTIKEIFADTPNSVMDVLGIGRGRDVIGLAQSHQAASVLQEAAKLDVRNAIAGFIRQYKNYGKDFIRPGSVLLIDEAGLVGTRDLEKLLQIAKECGAKIILMGDEKQLSPVSAGPALRLVMQQTGEFAEISTIRRQKEAWAREMVKDFAVGNADTALQELDARGHLHLVKNRDSTIKSMLNAWDNARDGQSELLMVAVKNADVGKLNDLARDRLMKDGLLDERLEVRLDSTAAEFYRQPGDKPVEKEHRTASFCPGDRIVFGMKGELVNPKTGKGSVLDGDASLVLNRTQARILEINRKEMRCEILVDGKSTGNIVRIDLEKFRKLNEKTGLSPIAITHAYAMTGWSSQGVTVDRAFVLSDGMDRRYGYVAMSRHRYTVDLFVDSGAIKQRLAAKQDEKAPIGDLDIKKELARQLHVNSVKASATDYLSGTMAEMKVRAKLETKELIQRMKNSPWAVEAKKLEQVLPQIKRKVAPKSILASGQQAWEALKERLSEIRLPLIQDVLRKHAKEEQQRAREDVRRQQERQRQLEEQRKLKIIK